MPEIIDRATDARASRGDRRRDRGGFEIYRASKSALNQLMRSFAARHAGDPRTLLLMAPGWVQADLGGLQYLDYQGRTVRW